jgi:alanyl-tRNA synthetase
MTERLYYTDPTIVEFDASIVAERRDGDRLITLLDRSAFYPSSGGQLFDKGTLNDSEVLEVCEDESGEVLHFTQEQIGPVGTRVRGAVDRLRRWKNRQMHTAQHIVSQTAIRLFGTETVSVHLGDDYAAVELDTAELSAAESNRIESQTNDLISSNLDVEILFVTPEQASRIPLRKVPERSGVIRVIKIGEYDWSACGGTHCCRTGEVGLIKVTGVDKMRGRTLLKFLTGVQAMADYQLRFDVTDRLSRSQSCGVGDLPDKCDKLVGESKQLRKALSAALKELIPVRASRMAQAADKSGRFPLLVESISDSEAETAAPLAAEIALQISGLSVIVCGDKCQIAVAQNGDGDAGAIAKELAARFSLRGGGSPRAAQIGGIAGIGIEPLRSAIREIINRA